MRHETVKAITERRLNKVLDAFVPEELDMGDWGEKTFCGTKCCLAGKTALMFPTRSVKWEPGLFDPTTYRLKGASRAAQQALDLTFDQVYSLFTTSSWPRKFDNRYSTAKTGRGRLSALKARVKHFIATGI